MSAGVTRALDVIKRLRVIIIAIVLVVLVIGGLTLYAGIWPPLVVVESDSMQHSSTTSYIGVIDTGDLVIEKTVSGFGDIKTYLDGVSTGYSTYSEPGDVVIYRPYGSDARTPIIHRALCLVEYNATGGGYDVPSLKNIPSSSWSVDAGPKTWYNLHNKLLLSDVGYDHVTVRIDFQAMLQAFAGAGLTPHTGLITLGDHNQGTIDQNTMAPICKYPIKAEWIQGVARGEVPWFGLLKLWISGPAPASVPENSKTDLFVAIGLIIGVPIIIDATGVILERKGIDAGAWLRAKLHLKPKSGSGQEGEKAKEDPRKPKDSPPQRKSAKPPSTSTKKKR